LVKDNDDRCVRPQSSDGSGGDGGANEGDAAVQCNVNPCPPDQTTGSTDPGRCCDDGFCSCGGECCGGPECWVVRTELLPPAGSEVPVVRFEERCTPPADCTPCPASGDDCCDGCAPGGGCIESPGRFGSSIRRR
jgi:hypothetical protein